MGIFFALDDKEMLQWILIISFLSLNKLQEWGVFSISSFVNHVMQCYALLVPYNESILVDALCSDNMLIYL